MHFIQSLFSHPQQQAQPQRPVVGPGTAVAHAIANLPPQITHQINQVQPAQHANQPVYMQPVQSVDGFNPQDAFYGNLQAPLSNPNFLRPGSGYNPQVPNDYSDSGVVQGGGNIYGSGNQAADPFGWVNHPQFQAILRTYKGY